MKLHNATGTVIKAADLTDELKALKGDDADVVAYASVEVEDRDNDVVRVDGISLKNHRDDSPVKLFASHLRSLPNGESPVIGRVVKFARVTHKETGKPALAFSAKFAGTPLGKHYAQHYSDGTMTDFSIGFRVHESEPLGKGLDFKKSELMEVSAVAIPANMHASVMRAYEETYPESADQSELARKWMSEPNGVLAVLKSIESHIAKFKERLDDLEDTFYAGRSKACADATDGHTEAAKSDEQPVSATTAVDVLSAIKAALDGLPHLPK